MSARKSVLLIAVAVLAAVAWAFHSEYRIQVEPERSLDEVLAAQEASHRFIDAFAHESEQRWTRIHWRPLSDVMNGVAPEEKPILILLSVREIGTQDPARC